MNSELFEALTLLEKEKNISKEIRDFWIFLWHMEEAKVIRR